MKPGAVRRVFGQDRRRLGLPVQSSTGEQGNCIIFIVGSPRFGESEAFTHKIPVSTAGSLAPGCPPGENSDGETGTFGKATNQRSHPPVMKPITVVLAEDHMIVREGLRALLKLEADIEVVGEAENGREAVILARQLNPSVIVMDIAMPVLNGFEATRQILRSAPATKVLILSAHSDDAYVERVMLLGAAGYLIKQSAARVLPAAIREVYRGNLFFSPSVLRRRDHHKQKAHDSGEAGSVTAAPKLSPREMEVLQLIAEGKANKETADVLHISIKTVEKHRQKVMEKLNIHDTASLTRYAISAGIIESSVQPTTL